jgi:predicted acylesterase/phospholipase RssA
VTPGGDLGLADYSKPTRSCDVVMKGGITSGVVYPHAVCTLAETYRFKNVGGTSAGAIAAAATAAAEYGRASRGFNKLAGLPDWMGADGNLRGLFQPQGSTASLFAILIGSLEGGFLKGCRTAIGKHPVAFLAGAALGIALLALALFRGLNHGFDALVLVALLAGALLALAGSALAVILRMARQISRSIPDNGFGLCSGGPGAKPSDAVPLTPWLTDLLNDYAGLPKGAEPITFGHLWAGPGGDRAHPPEDPEERYLQMAMMTTNLTNRRAHQLPWDSREWFFDPAEFRELFPAEVVDWMVDHPPQPRPADESADIRATQIRQALALPRLPLPSPADLPVIVATRMSLSFPVLLSAVPLWQLDMTRKDNEVLNGWRKWARSQPEGWAPPQGDPASWPAAGQPDSRPELERCWFSDGGISSNFPVHFFDRLVPRWPTFAINLRPFALGTEPDRENQANNTTMVKSNQDGIADWWYRLPERPPRHKLIDKRLFEFLASAIRTMQNRVDEAQMRVPGYRDRVAHVNMSDGEGGMNLTMPAETIRALTERGRAAAQRLEDAYTPPDPPDKRITWDNHRWVRLRSSLAVLEQMHGHFADGYSKEPATSGERTYGELVNRDREDVPRSYRWTGIPQRELALDEIQAILDVVAAFRATESVAVDAPLPTPEGRITPKD